MHPPNKSTVTLRVDSGRKSTCLRNYIDYMFLYVAYSQVERRYFFTADTVRPQYCSPYSRLHPSRCTPYSVLRTEQPEIPARHVHRPKRQVLGARLATAETLVPAFPFHHSI
jgi:hypothetical protein